MPVPAAWIAQVLRGLTQCSHRVSAGPLTYSVRACPVRTYRDRMESCTSSPSHGRQDSRSSAT